MENHLSDVQKSLRVLRGCGGRVYWTGRRDLPDGKGQVRVWIGQRFLDLGFHTLPDTERAAESLAFQLRVIHS